MQIAPGSQVMLHLSLALSDGTVVENTFEDEPIVFVLGDGTLDEGLELALYGLNPGDTQTLTLMPGQAFGMPDPAAVNHVPITVFPETIQIETGSVVGFTSPDGEELAGTVIAVGTEDVEVDFNHPLAGKEIVFTVKVLSVEIP